MEQPTIAGGSFELNPSPEAARAIEVLATADAIEADLEKRAFEESAAKIASENPGLLQRYGESRAQKILYAGMLAAGLFPGNLTPSERGPEESPERMEAREIIENRLGLDFWTLERDFDVRMDVPVEKGSPYIIHIGQAHIHQDYLQNAAVRSETVAIQKNMEYVLLHLNERGAHGIWGEGFSDTDSAVSLKEQVEFIKRNILAIPLTPDGFDKFAAVYYEVFINKSYNILYAEYVQYYLKQKFAELEAHFTKNADAGPNPFNNPDTAKLIGFLKKVLDLDLRGKDAPHYTGAVLKLYFENKIDLLPAEDEVVVSAAGAARKKVQESGTPTELEEARALFDKYAIDMREDIAIKKIGDDPTAGGNAAIIPLVYGSFHDFSDNVKKRNKSHGEGETDFGLIKLTPR
ncbi:hypothetical protein L0Y49_00665 [bacterium]|nr:hypothetical protein [bacterium]